MSSMLAASSRKSSSSTMVSANSSTSAGGLASAAIGMRPTRWGASHAMARRSLRTSAGDLRALHLDDHGLAGVQRARRGPGRWTPRPAACGRTRRRWPRAWCRGRPRRPRRTTAKVSGVDLVPAELELLDQLGREQPLAGGDDLAELDVRRARATRRPGGGGGTGRPGWPRASGSGAGACGPATGTSASRASRAATRADAGAGRQRGRRGEHGDLPRRPRRAGRRRRPAR